MQHATPAPRSVVVMGVSGCGKSTLAAALAKALRLPLIEGDDLHPPENLAKMGSGIALRDADRLPWLRRLAAELSRRGPAVLACSALRRGYRDVLRDAGPLAFVHLTGPRDLLLARLKARAGHFFPSALLESQLATLEPLTPDEAGVTVDLALPPDAQAETALRWLRRQGVTPPNEG